MVQILEYYCPNEQATISLGQALATVSDQGDVWALYGTLGMGKSVWARAFIQHLTAAKEVPSPTFTLVQVYETLDLEIFHYDLYRLKSPEEIWELNIEEAMGQGICLIEWPEKMGAYLPRTCMRVRITPWDNNGRKFEIEVPEQKAKRILECCIKPDAVHEK